VNVNVRVIGCTGKTNLAYILPPLDYRTGQHQFLRYRTGLKMRIEGDFGVALYE
jgi:hypothetical protein